MRYLKDGRFRRIKQPKSRQFDCDRDRIDLADRPMVGCITRATLVHASRTESKDSLVTAYVRRKCDKCRPKAGVARRQRWLPGHPRQRSGGPRSACLPGDLPPPTPVLKLRDDL